MKNITIITPQNVTIELEGASFILRTVAFVVDAIVKILLIIFLGLTLDFLDLGKNLELLFVYFVMFPVAFFYSFIFELFMHGQTPGKMITSIAARMEDGTELTANACFTRWFLRVVDIYITMGSLAAILLNATEKEQRLGDMMAGTIVVKKKKTGNVSLEAILKLQKKNLDYIPKYPQIVSLKEDDILWMKSTVLRYQRHKNKAHQEALVLLSNHISKLLGLEEKPTNQIDFIKTCVKDYIVLTR